LGCPNQPTTAIGFQQLAIGIPRALANVKVAGLRCLAESRRRGVLRRRSVFSLVPRVRLFFFFAFPFRSSKTASRSGNDGHATLNVGACAYATGSSDRAPHTARNGLLPLLWPPAFVVGSRPMLPRNRYTGILNGQCARCVGLKQARNCASSRAMFYLAPPTGPRCRP
jgi:hypothetical protein